MFNIIFIIFIVTTDFNITSGAFYLLKFTPRNTTMYVKNVQFFSFKLRFVREVNCI
jgi:hypothetical protein